MKVWIFALLRCPKVDGEATPQLHNFAHVFLAGHHPGHHSDIYRLLAFL